MTKILSVRLEDSTAALITEKAARSGISINQAINDAIVQAAHIEQADVASWADEAMATYSTVMERLG